MFWDQSHKKLEIGKWDVEIMKDRSKHIDYV